MRTDSYNINRPVYRKRRKRNGRKLFLLAGVAGVAAVILIVGVFGILSKPSDGEKNSASVPQTQATQAETVTPVTENTTEETQPTDPTVAPVKENCEEFEETLTRAGYSCENIDSEQLITVDAYGDTAVVNAFEKVEGVWVKADVLNLCSGYVGSQGVSSDASEYASYTPKGLFSLGTGFGICDDPGTGLDYFKVTGESYWVDDENSAYYNQYVEGTDNKDWNSAEHLIEYEGYYDYCVFIEYNTDPVVPGKGSAFFLHVGNSPTAGCVAIPEDDMVSTLRWLHKAKNPQILIF